jgi:hypothetical protein
MARGGKGGLQEAGGPLSGKRPGIDGLNANHEAGAMRRPGHCLRLRWRPGVYRSIAAGAAKKVTFWLWPRKKHANAF